VSPSCKAGDVFRVKYPFILERVSLRSMDEEGCGSYETDSWRPGISEDVDHGGNPSYALDGYGEMVLTVVDVFRPGRFPTRVFYTRSWVDPDGRTFGKGALRITTAANFTKLRRGYRYPYAMQDEADMLAYKPRRQNETRQVR
jgi:hypothetical protein